MARTKEEHEKGIIEVIKNHKVTNISHIFVFYTDCNRATFYNLDLDKLDSIKEAININKQKACNFMIQKWIASDRDALQISAFKILCSDEERRALSMNHQDITTNGKDIVSKYSDWTPEQIRAEIQRLDDK